MSIDFFAKREPCLFLAGIEGHKTLPAVIAEGATVVSFEGMPLVLLSAALQTVAQGPLSVRAGGRLALRISNRYTNLHPQPRRHRHIHQCVQPEKIDLPAHKVRNAGLGNSQR